MTPWKTLIWQQFGAAIDMLDNALRACPVQQWRDSLWDDPTDGPEYTEFWFIVYHTLFWLDLYLSGGSREDFAPPAPFIAGRCPTALQQRGASRLSSLLPPEVPDDICKPDRQKSQSELQIPVGRSG